MLRIRLHPEELAHLKRAKHLPAHLGEYIRSVRSIANRSSWIDISPEMAEDFRHAFCDRLQEVGFDRWYKLTPEGEILEGLIDRFFCG